MVNFPTYLIALFPLDEEPESAVVRTPMESGVPKQLKTRYRPMLSRKIAYVARSLADYNSFKTWVKDSINYGTDWFNWIDPTDSVTKTARLVNGRFAAKATSPALTSWDISMEIETVGF